MSKTETMDDYSRNAVESFIQTVVFVDDKIYAPPPDGKVVEVPLAAPPKVRKPSIKGAVKKNQPKSDQDKVQIDPPEFSPHDIQASFAKKHIVCSLHQPRKTDSVGESSNAYKLCASADIVIVDWDLYGDAGEKATVLIDTLVTKSLEEDPHQLRLALIYTNDPDLFSISAKVYEQLAEKVPTEIDLKDSDEGLAFHTLNARVVVLGKPAKRLPKYEPYEVREEDLADRAIEEFCKLTNGLLQGGILKGLAAIRKQSRKILTKFNSGLDAAFLTHRALGLPHEEAFDHITPLLVAEIEAVLEDSISKPLISDDVISDWCLKWIPSDLSTKFVPKGVDVHTFASDFCTKGMGIADSYNSGKAADLEKCIKPLKKDLPEWPSADAPQFKTLTSYLSNDSSGNDLRELAVLMSHRTQYGDSRHLTLGTIIREIGGDKRYLLCLQPTCDCIRLSKPSTFIFCTLNMATGEKATHVVNDGTSYIDLRYKPKVEGCVTLIFKPSKGFVSAKDLKFTDHPGAQDYRWVAQLKPKHAQRAAEQFARELSRVGLTESEWLRLKSKYNHV